jgi:hypothetical protein
LRTRVGILDQNECGGTYLLVVSEEMIDDDFITVVIYSIFYGLVPDEGELLLDKFIFITQESDYLFTSLVIYRLYISNTNELRVLFIYVILLIVPPIFGRLFSSRCGLVLQIPKMVSPLRQSFGNFFYSTAYS